MAKGSKQPVAQVRAAQLSSCRAAGTDNDPVSAVAILAGQGEKFSLFPPQFRNLAAGNDLHIAPLLQCQAQHVDHAVGAVTVGIDSPALLRRGQQSQAVKKRQGALHAEFLQGKAAKLRRLAVVMGRR